MCLMPQWHFKSTHLDFFIRPFSFPTLQPGSKMVTSAKSSVPTVTDQAAAMQLGQCAKNLATCLAELRTSAQKVKHRHKTGGHVCGSVCRKSLCFRH